MTIQTTITARLLEGESPAEIAGDLSLDLIDNAVVLPGWWGDDGNADVEYPDVDSGREAAEAYVADGDWGDAADRTSWVRVYTWRIGLRAAHAECAYCSATASAWDGDGDPACATHAVEGAVGAPLWRVVEVRLDEDDHKVEIEPTEPDCVDHADHDYRAPHRLVGGIRENPGVWGHGGGVVATEVCVRCGLLRETDTWAQDRATGEQGLHSVRYHRDTDPLGEYLAELRERIERGEDLLRETTWGAPFVTSAGPHLPATDSTLVGRAGWRWWAVVHDEDGKVKRVEGPFHEEAEALTAA